VLPSPQHAVRIFLLGRHRPALRSERSATWSNWTTIRTDTANVNPMTVTDTVATNRMNFYRVRRLPNP
jgi:hypothetical protein